jgi:hypothetical protein
MNHAKVHSVIEETVEFKERFPDVASEYDIVDAICDIVNIERPLIDSLMWRCIMTAYNDGEDAAYMMLAAFTGNDYRKVG